jgi:hypothetical protein
MFFEQNVCARRRSPVDSVAKGFGSAPKIDLALSTSLQAAVVTVHHLATSQFFSGETKYHFSAPGRSGNICRECQTS